MARELIETLDVVVREVWNSGGKFLEIKIGEKKLCVLRWEEPILPGGSPRWWLQDGKEYLALGTNRLDAVNKALEHFGYKAKGEAPNG